MTAFRQWNEWNKRMKGSRHAKAKRKWRTNLANIVGANVHPPFHRYCSIFVDQSGYFRFFFIKSSSPSHDHHARHEVRIRRDIAMINARNATRDELKVREFATDALHDKE